MGKSKANLDKSKLGREKGKNIQGMQFKKGHGQHILKNPAIVNAIVDKSAIKGSDIVMEVGSGTGNLSMKIIEKAKKLIAFEIDNRMIAELKKRVMGTANQFKLEVYPGDVLKLKEWPAFDICVSNIPYQISSPFVFRILQQRPLPRHAVIMFQKEFADRLIAKPGTKMYCRLSVSVQFLAKVEHLMRVKKTEFRPPPKVDSAVIRIEPKNPPPPIQYHEWDGLLRLAFIRKNKTLLSIFKQNQVVDLVSRNYQLVCQAKEKKVDKNFCAKTLIEEVLTKSGFANKRARNMAIEDFLALLLAFNESDIHFV